jgi:hypothetical protein
LIIAGLVLALRLGGIYEKKGNRARARTEYQTELEPGLADAREALRKPG